MPGFYSVIIPVGDRRSLNSNPSFEIGTAGYGTITSGTIGTTSGVQAFGAWAGSWAPGNNGTAGVTCPTFTAGNGTAYSWSFYGSFPVGSTFIAGMADSAGANYQAGTLVGTGGGSWHRYMGSYSESSGGVRRLAIRKNNSAVTTANYIDAVQYEAGSITTYIDGDQGVGYSWDGQPHASSSLRSASVRTGGSVYSLGDLGFTVLDAQGVGMPDVNVVVQDYGYLDGGFYQRTRANARSFTLTGLMSGTTWQGLHALRQQVIDAIKPDLTPNPQPFRILYTGAGGSMQIDCVYDSGLSYGGWNGFAEQAAIRFIAPDPYWTTITERGTSLAPVVNLGSVNYLAYRSPQGQWGTLGVAGTTVKPVGATLSRVIAALAYNNGTLYLGGGFGTVGGTSYPSVAFYAGGVFGTFVGGTIALNSDDAVRDLAIDSFGTVYAAGVFASASGSTAGRDIARYTNGSWLPLSGGTITGPAGATTLLSYGGTIFVSGVFTGAGGTTVDGVAMYGAFSNLWGSMGIPGGGVAFAAGLDGTIYGAAGTKWTAVGAATATLTATSDVTVRGYGVDRAGKIYYGGNAGSTYANVIANSIAVYNGAGFAPLGSGIRAGAALAYIRRIVQLADGRMAVAGSFDSVNGNTWFPRGLAYWTGGNWVPSDIILQTNGVNDIAVTPDGATYIGGTFNGTATAAVVTTVITSPSSADSYPRIVLRAPSSGTARVYQTINTTNQNALWYNLVLQPNETATLNLAAGSTSFVSNLRGLINTVLPGSNLAKWRLSPGTNYVSFLADNPSLQVDLVYRPRFWSNDENAA